MDDEAVHDEGVLDESVPERVLLLAFLKDRDVACPLCQYNLRNLTIPTCPECGKQIELAVKAREVSVQSWATLTVALSLQAGVGIIPLFVILTRGARRMGSTEWVIGLVFIAMIPLAITAFVMRRKFLRLSQQVQFALAALAVCSAVVCFILLLSTAG